MSDSVEKKKSMPWLRLVIFSVLTGGLTFIQSMQVVSWLSPLLLNFLILISAPVVFFCWPKVKKEGEVDAADRGWPRSGLLPLGLTQASLLLWTGVLGFLLLLRGSGSRRMVGIPIEHYHPASSPGIIIAVVVGMALLGTGFLAWRDWRKHRLKPVDVTWHRACFAMLVFSSVMWAFILMVLCVPSVFLDIIGE